METINNIHVKNMATGKDYNANSKLRCTVKGMDGRS